jgi:hypothetical protein
MGHRFHVMVLDSRVTPSCLSQLGWLLWARDCAPRAQEEQTREGGTSPLRPPLHRANRVGPQERRKNSPSHPPNGHCQPSADFAAGPAGPRGRCTMRRSNRGFGGSDPGPRGPAPGCGAARRGPGRGLPAAAHRAREPDRRRAGPRAGPSRPS